MSGPGGVSGLGERGVSVPGGVCSGGDLVWSGGVIWSGPGVSALGVWSGGCLLWGVWSRGLSQHALRQTPLPVDRILDKRLRKYYLGPTSLRPVIIVYHRLQSEAGWGGGEFNLHVSCLPTN